MNRIGEPHERHDIIENKPVKEICNDPRCPMNRMGLKHEIHENGWFNESAEADTSQMGGEHGSSIPPKHSGKKTDRKPTRNVPAENVQSGEHAGNPRRIHSTGKISHPPNDLGPADKAAEDRTLNSNDPYVVGWYEHVLLRKREDRILNSNDPYVVLGVPRNATNAEIKSAYWNLVKMFNPSKGALHKSVAEQEGYDQIMKKINRAYGQIKNMRSSYTRHAQYTTPRKNSEAETTQRPPGDSLNDLVDEIWRGALSSSRRRERSDDPTERRILTSDDPYTVLGVSRNTSYQDIQSSYLDLAMTYGKRVKASRRSNAASRYKEIMTKINNAFEQLKKDHTSSETHLDDLADAILRDAMPDNHRQHKRTDKENTQPSSDLGSADKAAENRIMNSNDPHVVLGVPRNATGAEIKSAHRNLVKMFHPSKGALLKSVAEQKRYNQIMKKINRAYEQKRTRKGGQT